MKYITKKEPIAMNEIKCPVCGGQLEYSRSGLKMTCPYCDAVFETPEAEARPKKKKPVFDPEMFIVEQKIKDELSSEKHKSTDECLRTISYCLSEFQTPDEIAGYMRKYIRGKDLAAPGINEVMIDKVMSRVSSEMKSDEKIILYYDRGLIMKNKEFLLLTDKRLFFVNKRNCLYVFHEDVDRLELNSSGDCPMWEINDDYERTIPSVTSAVVQGAMIAYICLSGFIKDPDKNRIKLF